MHISHLSLTNFRNYSRLERAFTPGTTLLYGSNAQGKTNLLEAIYYLATTRSPFAEQDSQLINWEAGEQGDLIVVGRIQATVVNNDGPRQLEMRLIRELKGRSVSFRREALVDRSKVRLMDLLGHLRVVLFLPSDVQLVTGSPSERRRYLNITLCQIDPAYCRQLSRYNKMLEQRNALLRQIGEGTAKRDVLPVFTERLVTLGGAIFQRRAAFMQQMARLAQRIHYELLTDGKESIRMHYVPRLHNKRLITGDAEQTAVADGDWLMAHQADETAVAQRFSAALAAAQSIDISRGSTSVGPHRDDWLININGRNLGYFGSRGQQRSAILALKMAEIEWMTAVTGEKPLLLLDEVVAELDEQRRASLLTAVLDSTQSMLTATDPGMFTNTFLQQATSYFVANGRITPADPA